MNTRIAVCFALLLASAVTAAPAQVHYLEITNPAYRGPTPANRPNVATYEWRTIPGSPAPVGSRFIMLSTWPFDGRYGATLDYIRSHPDAPEWSPWTPIGYTETVTRWTSPLMPYGGYVLAVQGRDAQGVPELTFDENRNARRILILPDLCWPELTVTGDLIDPIVTHWIYPVTEIDAAAGTELRFCLEASHTCEQPILGYRLGWDIADPDDDDAWGMPFTPFATPQVCSATQTFMTGSHTFTAEIIDNSGYKARVPILVHIGPATPVEQTTWGRIKALYSE